MEYDNVMITIPKSMTYLFKVNDPQDTFKQNALLLYPYIKNQTISLGKAAQMLGMDKWSLVEYYEQNGLMCFETSVDEYLQDIKTIEKVRSRYE